MTTRADLCSSSRLRLEDTAASPPWDDAFLNDALVEAIRVYGTSFPVETTSATAAVTDGSTSVALPAAVLEGQRIVSVRDAHGRDVPPQGRPLGPAPADAEQSKHRAAHHRPGGRAARGTQGQQARPLVETSSVHLARPLSRHRSQVVVAATATARTGSRAPATTVGLLANTPIPRPALAHFSARRPTPARATSRASASPS
jgi:hypothetical protein